MFIETSRNKKNQVGEKELKSISEREERKRRLSLKSKAKSKLIEEEEKR